MFECMMALYHEADWCIWQSMVELDAVPPGIALRCKQSFINAMSGLFCIRAIIRDIARKFITARYAPRANSKCAPRLILDYTECEKMFVQYPYSHLHCCLNTIYRFKWNISKRILTHCAWNYLSQSKYTFPFFNKSKLSIQKFLHRKRRNKIK